MQFPPVLEVSSFRGSEFIDTSMSQVSFVPSAIVAMGLSAWHLEM